MITVNFENVKDTGSSSKPPAGGYILEVKRVQHNESKMSIRVEFDISGGEYDGYYQDLFDSIGWWALVDYKSYKSEAAVKFLYQFVHAMEISNKDYVWDGDETRWIGLKVGAVLGYEEYIGNDGKTKQKGRIVAYKPTSDIVSGNYKVPELKTLESNRPTGPVINNSVKFEPINDEDHPF